MSHVVFVAPHAPESQIRFVRALKRVGATVTGLGDQVPSDLDPQVKYLLDGYEYVGPDLSDVDALTAAVQRVQARGPWVHRLEATTESLLWPTAVARERTGIPGLSAEQVVRCRDKLVMKQFLSARGIPTARHALCDGLASARAFVDAVGYPVVLKPRLASDPVATCRVDDDAGLVDAVDHLGVLTAPGAFTLEEFIVGHEGFYDTLTIDGRVVHEFATHYYPNVLEAMQQRWISPQLIHTNRLEADGYDALREFGRRVIGALALGTTATHMEWFSGPRGLLFSEIGARPPGFGHWDLYCEANGIDLYADWARAIAYGRVEEVPHRRYAAGLINLRPTCDGVITGYEGIERMQVRYGPGIFRLHLPPVGSRTSPIGAGYLVNAYVCVRHPDYDGLRAVLDDVGRTVKVLARPA